MSKGTIYKAGTEIFLVREGGRKNALSARSLPVPVLNALERADANSVPVEYEFAENRVQYIRLADQSPTRSLDQGRDQPARLESCPHADLSNLRPRPELPSEFYHPYQFVKTLQRKQDGKLGDREPAPHDRFHPDLYSGTISFTMEAITPLLLRDKLISGKAEHKEYEPRVDANGLPILNKTSVKGMLRNAFETITNSRFGVFFGRDNRLGFRMLTRGAADLRPFRIQKNAGGDLEISLFENAAWMPAYRNGRPLPGLPNHGDARSVFLQPWRKTGARSFSYQKVISKDSNGSWMPQPFGAHQTAGGVAAAAMPGYAWLSNYNMNRKHDERVFCGSQKMVRLTPGLKRAWRELITDYQEIHRDEIEDGATGPPVQQGNAPPVSFSRHVLRGGKIPEEDRDLREGSMGFARMENGSVADLYPVMISRSLHACSPEQLLDPSLHPAKATKDFSPAERVFGWVREGKGDGAQAYRGNLRIQEVRAEPGSEPDKTPRQIGILGSPKPTWVQGYVVDGSGNGFNGGPREGYQGDKKLAGRKVYPTQANWSEEKSNWRAFKEDKASQFATVHGWVPAGAKFKITLQVKNLSAEEAGALLYLLKMEPGCCLKFGGGKPLGFGNVRLKVDECELAMGDDWGTYFGDLQASPPVNSDPEGLVKDFVNVADSGILEQFKIACIGHTAGKPTCYPGLEWFNANRGNIQPQPLPHLRAKKPYLKFYGENA